MLNFAEGRRIYIAEDLTSFEKRRGKGVTWCANSKAQLIIEGKSRVG